MSIIELILQVLPVLLELIKELIDKSGSERKAVLDVYRNAAEASGDALTIGLLNNMECLLNNGWTAEQFDALKAEAKFASEAIAAARRNS